jgi:hypothetical protein
VDGKGRCKGFRERRENAHGYLRINKAAKLFAASPEGQKYTLSNAVLVDNPGKRILFNFFMLFFKPATPTQPVSSQEEAFSWLLLEMKKQAAIQELIIENQLINGR